MEFILPIFKGGQPFRLQRGLVPETGNVQPLFMRVCANLVGKIGGMDARERVRETGQPTFIVCGLCSVMIAVVQRLLTSAARLKSKLVSGFDPKDDDRSD